jgi:hypothetical protein
MPYVLLVLLLVAVIVAAVVVQKRAGAARARIEAGLSELDVLRQDKANCYGRESAETAQPRAIGALALTPTELVFLQFVASSEDIHIPRSAITGVELARSFMGKTQNRDLLVVTWTHGDDGGVDRAAFDVDEVADWRTDLGHHAGGTGD